MSITRWMPRSEIVDFYNGMNDFLNKFWETEKAETSMFNFIPQVDIEEKESEYKISVELPGVKKEDVIINLKGNVLSISGEKKFGNGIGRENRLFSERTYGKFQRCFRLSEKINQTEILAKFKNGILEITIPKAKEAIPKEVEIKVK